MKSVFTKLPKYPTVQKSLRFQIQTKKVKVNYPKDGLEYKDFADDFGD